MYKVQILRLGAIDTTQHFEDTNKAIETFKRLTTQRVDEGFLYLLVNNTQLWSYDLRPETADIHRWRSKQELFGEQSIMPIWITAKEAAKIYETSVQRINMLKRYKLTEYFDIIMHDGKNMFDRRVLDKIFIEPILY